VRVSGSSQGGVLNDGTFGQPMTNDSSELRAGDAEKHRMGAPYERMEKQSPLDGLERRSQLGMSSTPIERHQPERTKNEEAATTTSIDCHMVFATQPVELLEEINGLRELSSRRGT